MEYQRHITTGDRIESTRVDNHSDEYPCSVLYFYRIPNCIDSVEHHNGAITEKEEKKSRKDREKEAEKEAEDRTESEVAEAVEK